MTSGQRQKAIEYAIKNNIDFDASDLVDQDSLQTQAKAVAYALAYNRSLKSLFLVHCSINHEAQRHISAGVVSNNRLALRKLTGFDVGRKYKLEMSNFIHSLSHTDILVPFSSYSGDHHPWLSRGFEALDK